LALADASDTKLTVYVNNCDDTDDKYAVGDIISIRNLVLKKKMDGSVTGDCCKSNISLAPEGYELP
jgi:hypothetical protein